MAGPLRGRAPLRRADSRGGRGRQVARHSGQGADDRQTPRSGHSGHLRNGVRGPLPGPVEMHLHHRLERQDDYYVAHLQDPARRRLQRSPRRQHRREFRLLGRYRRLRLVRTGVELVPARRHVPVPRPYRRADEHHARPPRPLRLLFPELRGCQDAHYAEPEFARLLHLFGRRRGDLAAVAQIRPADEAAPLRGQKRRGERRRRCVPPGRKIHRDGRPGVGGDRHGQNADSRAAQRL